jgi:3'-phosphoadenosine 5'-phosphosulfate sulfotransferase (PAPS reductase)/FAD synthetase
MLNKKGDNMNIFEKKKLILTEWDNSAESRKNFKKAIKKLKAENIPFIIVEKRLASEWAKKLYISYSVVMDSILLITVILALLNADKILKLLS